MVIAVTGANGFIGNALCAYLLQQGHRVQRWVRQPVTGNDYPYNLRSPESLPSLQGVDAVVHCAYVAYSPAQLDAAQVNLQAIQALAAACKAHHVQLVFISSLSAHPESVSVYGKQKQTCEQALDTSQHLILRPGLVIGRGGLFQKIQDTLRSSCIIPLPDGGRQPVQIIAIEDLVKAIHNCLLQKRTGTYTLATPQVYTVRTLYEAIAGLSGVRPRLFNVPIGLLLPIVKIAEWLGVPLPITSENLNGLRKSIIHLTQKDLQTLGLQLQDLNQALQAHTNA